MIDIRRAIIRLARVGHSRGFGIQSPWSYRLVTSVIRDTFPSHHYDKVAAEAVCDSRRQLTLCRLYFRLADFFQPQTVIDYGAEADIYKRYIEAGCPESNVISIGKSAMYSNKTMLANVNSIDMLRMSIVDDRQQCFDEAMQKTHNGTVFIIEDIYGSRTAREWWKKVRKDSRCTLTYDLYDCGIIYFDKKRYKENYTVNI